MQRASDYSDHVTEHDCPERVPDHQQERGQFCSRSPAAGDTSTFRQHTETQAAQLLRNRPFDRAALPRNSIARDMRAPEFQSSRARAKAQWAEDDRRKTYRRIPSSPQPQAFLPSAFAYASSI